MKLKQVVYSAVLLFCFSAVAQKKQLTLSDAVMQQFRAYAADKVDGFQWIPGTNKYTFTKNKYTELHLAAENKTEPVEILTVAEFNKTFATNLTNFFGYRWIDANTLALPNKNGFIGLTAMPVKEAFRLVVSDEAENVTPSNNYKIVAYTKANNLFALVDGKEVQITDFSAEIVSGQAIARSEFGITNGIFISPDAKYIAFYQKNESEVAQYPLLDLTSTPGTLNNIRYPMAGQKSEKPRVGIYSIESGKTVYVSPRGATDDYLTNFAWTPDSKAFTIAEVNRAQNAMELNIYSAAGQFQRTLFTETDNTWVEPEHAAYFPNPKKNEFIWISERDGYNNLYLYDLNGKLLRKLTQNLFPVIDILGATAKEIYFTATGENGTNTLVYAVDFKGKQRLITKDLGVHAAKLNEFTGTLFDEYSNLNTPNISQILPVKGSVTKLVESPDKLKDVEIGTTEIVQLKAADGKTDLYARLIKPSNFDASKKYPVLIYVYGGPHAQMVTNSYLAGANLWMHWLAEKGYLVFTVDNRGSSNRGAAFEHVIHRNLGTNELADQLSGVAYLKSLPYVDASRLAVHGWSFGGFMTNTMLLKAPDTFKVGVAGGPVTDWAYYEIMYGERYMDTPAENPEGYKTAALRNYVKNLKGKLLLIHGTSDDVVVEQHNLDLVKNFVEAGVQIDYFPYPMHKHNVRGKDRVHLMEKVLNYVLEHN
ncbi:DPP IV N-terminal domain-containing protein [Flavobacterium sp.]|uniref:S9 family peptidase n=1 Tax=Flavobacterium sp. TaxID=239 RepID=UPI00261FB002|nr:DPP IV N-terminal domain-containing protein [Flavobacterium sp.]